MIEMWLGWASVTLAFLAFVCIVNHILDWIETHVRAR